MISQKRLVVPILLFLTAPLFAQSRATLPSLEHLTDSLLYAGEYVAGEQLVRSVLSDPKYVAGNMDSISGYATYMLGVFALDRADYAASDEALQKAIEINSRLYSSHHPIVASAWSRLARLYSEQGRYRDAVHAADEQVSAYRIEFGADNRYTALANVSLAEYALLGGDIATADAHASALSTPLMSGFGNSSPESIRFQRLEGDIAFGKHRFVQANTIYSVALDLLSSDHKPRPELQARLELARARTRAILDDPDSAAQDIIACRQTITRLNPASYSLPALSSLVYGSIEELRGYPDSAFAHYEEALKYYRNAATVNFSYTSERERLEFLREIHRTSGRVFSTAIRTNLIYPKGCRTAYDWLLFEKAAGLTSFSAIRSAAARSGDSLSAQFLARMRELASRRSALHSSDSLLLRRPFYTSDSLDTQIERLQKQLVRRSHAFTGALRDHGARWQQVKDRLSPTACAVEIALFPYFDGERETDTSYYSAFAINSSDSEGPKTSLIGTSRKLDDPVVMRAYYSALEPGRRNREALRLVSNLLWPSIAELIGDRNKLFIAPDGIYSQVSLPMLPLDGRTDLIDKCQISILANTADLLRDTDGLAPQSLSIFADPAFGQAKLPTPGKSVTTREKGFLKDLPATKTEAQSIAKAFHEAGWNVRQYIGSDATERNLDKLGAQRIVHIATHATFRDDTASAKRTISNELLECALYLGGANNALRGPQNDPKNDGIVSGLEAMYLDLQGTDLVTLSACESGRGSIEPGEGVLGFPRALRTAGARNILMSLWRVPDRETAELMTLFYTQLLEGDSKAAALRSAQLKMRTTIKKRWGTDEPLFWAGFELIGF